MSFFKSFTKNSNYSPLSQNDGSSTLPAPATQTNPNSASNQNPRSFKTRLQKLNPFRDNSIYLEDDENYVTSEPGYFELSKWDRMLIFALTFAGSVCCYLICIFLFPVLTLKPRKFAILWSLGSIFFIVSFGVLQGFKAYMEHLFSSTRLLFTITFVTSIILTLISALSLKSVLLSIIFSAIQLVSALWYTVSYFPMGRQTLNLAGSVARSQVDTWINT
ncbi:Got1/Sft2-like family-domain-containing protein [Scheffersomyces xylosifermentans]|uniref:Got1/Sft2-like family-domain-containing protein n=1 Tax=Scheffersomyces xylosifermentans TaxID=1304137 RepID=UPI00315DE8ED